MRLSKTETINNCSTAAVFMPGSGAGNPAGAAIEPQEEWPHLLDLIVFLPILSAVFLLFLPRQTPKFLRAFTLGVMATDFIASLFLLSGSMEKGWHYQHIVEWVPSLGIRYHVGWA